MKDRCVGAPSTLRDPGTAEEAGLRLTRLAPRGGPRDRASRASTSTCVALRQVEATRRPSDGPGVRALYGHRSDDGLAAARQSHGREDVCARQRRPTRVLPSLGGFGIAPGRSCAMRFDAWRSPIGITAIAASLLRKTAQQFVPTMVVHDCLSGDRSRGLPAIGNPLTLQPHPFRASHERR
jgi:hypothetical protein